MAAVNNVGGYGVDELMKRAIANARARDGKKVPRWAAVRDLFAVGSTTAMAVCRGYGFDPHEEVPGFVCERCAEDAG
jgi:hypothetical protein